MPNNNKAKNVKLPVELVELIKIRYPDRSPGEVLKEIYTEYMSLDAVARRVVKAKDEDKINISEAIERFFTDTEQALDKLQKSNDELKIMLQGLDMFIKKVKQ